jgi:hypothetical protein
VAELPTLDYNLSTPEERIEYVNTLLENNINEELPNKYLTYLADYILFVADKNQTKKERNAEHSIVTKNREITVSKRQVSFEEVVSNLENGEDGIYALISNDKNKILDYREPLTNEDFEKMPELTGYLNIIERLKAQFKKAKGQKKFSLKKQIIETWQQMYMLKASYTGAPARTKTPAQIKSLAHMDLDETIYLDANGYPQSTCMVSLYNSEHVSVLLTYYNQLKQESWEDLRSDMHWLLIDLDNLIARTLKDKPILRDLLDWKIAGYTNDEIQIFMNSKYGIQHTNQYFSTLWRNRIPKMIVEEAQKHYLVWYYTHNHTGTWKRCGKCGQLKLAHPLFFSKNNSKDSYYSICKECRNKH